MFYKAVAEKRVGRPKTPQHKIEQALKLEKSTLFTHNEILELVDISRSVFYRALREADERDV